VGWNDYRGDGPIWSLPLSPRELQICVAYADGHALKAVAEAFGISQQSARQLVDHAKTRYANAGRPAHTKLELRLRLIEDGHLSRARFQCDENSSTE
jgi:DNA-binding CsgD family transcriptional regulator